MSLRVHEGSGVLDDFGDHGDSLDVEEARWERCELHLVFIKKSNILHSLGIGHQLAVVVKLLSAGDVTRANHSLGIGQEHQGAGRVVLIMSNINSHHRPWCQLSTSIPFVNEGVGFTTKNSKMGKFWLGIVNVLVGGCELEGGVRPADCEVVAMPCCQWPMLLLQVAGDEEGANNAHQRPPVALSHCSSSVPVGSSGLLLDRLGLTDVLEVATNVDGVIVSA